MKTYWEFVQRNKAELKLALDEVRWWSDMVACGRVSPEHAAGHIKIEEAIIANKRLVLGL